VAPPEGFPERTAMKLMPFDPAQALAEETASRKRFADIFGQ
ncbi:MAG: Fe(3+) ABC transporter substrate-binding protein, partial [Hyphomicrobiales bacterium]|nr:Fe(3+) ABC transporter substrate-binding protein [Hyphomicrobiales bacterium]